MLTNAPPVQTDPRPVPHEVSNRSLDFTNWLYDRVLHRHSPGAFRALLVALRTPKHASCAAIALTDLIFSASRKILQHDDLYNLKQAIDRADDELRMIGNAQADLYYLDLIVWERLNDELIKLYSEQWDREGRQWVADLCRQYDAPFEPEVR